MSWAIEVGWAAIALVLVTAACGKLVRRDRLFQVVRNYRLGSDTTARRVARFLPMVELAVGGWMLTDMARTLVSIAAASLFLTFAAAIMINLIRGRSQIACGCFGADDTTPLSPSHVYVNVGLASIALLTSPPFSLAEGTAILPPSERLAAVLCAAILLTCGWLGAMSRRLLRGASL